MHISACWESMGGYQLDTSLQAAGACLRHGFTANSGCISAEETH